MEVTKMLNLLSIEHECMLRGSHGDCDRNCADCELVQDDGELHEMYMNVIAIVGKEAGKKPNDIKKHSYDLYMGWCHSCGCIVFDVHAYCPHCGQKQDWSDVKKGR